MSDVKDQIDEMLKMYDSADDTSATDSPSTDAPTTESVTTTSSPGTESPSTDAPTTDAPSEPEDDRTIEISKLKAEQEELKSKLNEILSKKPTEEPEKIEEINFIEDEDVDELLNDPKALNKLLNRVFLKGLEMNRKEVVKTAQDLRNELPGVVKTNIVTIEHLRRASEKFYKENVDLQPFKKVVSTVFDEIAASHPDWEYDKLLKQSEVETRKRLNLKKPDKVVEEKKDVPKLPHKRSQQRPTPSNKPSDPLLSDIDAMNEVLNRR
jgi:hypothetical protein